MSFELTPVAFICERNVKLPSHEMYRIVPRLLSMEHAGLHLSKIADTFNKAYFMGKCQGRWVGTKLESGLHA